MAAQSRVVIVCAPVRSAGLARNGQGWVVGERDHARRRPRDGTVIHHVWCRRPLAEPVLAIPVAVVEEPLGRALMTPPSTHHRLAPGFSATPRLAVPGQSATAPQAQEEGLATASADQPPTRVQGSPPWLACQNWTACSAHAKTRSGAILRPPEESPSYYSEPPHLTQGDARYPAITRPSGFLPTGSESRVSR